MQDHHDAGYGLASLFSFVSSAAEGCVLFLFNMPVLGSGFQRVWGVGIPAEGEGDLTSTVNWNSINDYMGMRASR